VRGRPAGAFGLAREYVNDRPYAASSFLSVAIARVFGSALGARSADRPELAATALPLEAKIPVLPCRRGGETLLHRLFRPLGYEVSVKGHPLDETLEGGGASPYFTLRLRGTLRLADLLAHLYVLIPVLDDEKHYWIGDDETAKLLRHGEGWLAAHPERQAIAQRYLRHRPLVREALSRLLSPEEIEAEAADAAESSDSDEASDDSEIAVAAQAPADTASAAEGDAPVVVRASVAEADEPGLAETATAEAPETEAPAKAARLNELRLLAARDALLAAGARRVLDLGCGEGALLRLLLREPAFAEIVGVDVSHRVLEMAARRLGLDRMSEAKRRRISLLHGSLTYRDARLAGFDAAAVIEVIEHFDPPRLPAFEEVLFRWTRPRTIVLTTPNADYNVRYPTLSAGAFRHTDHRFEWSREEFETWARARAERYGYAVSLRPVGPVDPEVGSPTQMAVFSLE
jgi:SAM-dependent methyltransferase